MTLDNIEHEKFAQAFVRKGETFNNRYLSYCEAYDYEIPLDAEGKLDYKSKEYRVAQVSGSRLYAREDVRARIHQLLLEKFNNVDTVDIRLTEIIEGGEDRDSLGAIKIYNDLKGRVTKKLDVTSNGRPLIGLSDEELAKMAEE